MITRRWLMDEWRDTFLLEARLHELPGDKIGEALAEVDTHCADSGQRPDVAFGDPVAYARTLAANVQPAGPAKPSPGPLRTAVMAFATFGGIFGLLTGVDAIAHGTRGTVTLGETLATLVGTVTVVFIAMVIFRPGRRHFNLWLGAVVFVGIGVPTFLQLALKQAVFHASGWVLLTTGLLLLTLAWWPQASNRIDRIVDPRTGGEPFRDPRLLIMTIRWLPPVVLLAVVISVILIPT